MTRKEDGAQLAMKMMLKQHVIIWQHNEDDLRDFAAGGATRALTFGSNVSIVAESHGKRTLCLRISSTYGSADVG